MTVEQQISILGKKYKPSDGLKATGWRLLQAFPSGGFKSVRGCSEKLNEH